MLTGLLWIYLLLLAAIKNVTVGSTFCKRDIAIKLNVLLIGFGFTSHV